MSGCLHTTWGRWTFPVALVAAAVFGASLLARPAKAAGGHTGYGCHGASRPPRHMSLHGLRSSVLCLVNRYREHYGLAPLRFNRDLRISATHHSKDMVAHDYFAHAGPRGSTPEQRVTRAGYLARVSVFAIGENIGGGLGRSFGSPRAVVRTWMHSAPHRANLLSSRYRDFGVGVVRGFPGGRGGRAATYTLDFGSRH